MEDSKGIDLTDLTEELRNVNDELRNGCEEVKNGVSDCENFKNGSGDNGEHQPLKIKSKVCL